MSSSNIVIPTDIRDYLLIDNFNRSGAIEDTEADYNSESGEVWVDSETGTAGVYTTSAGKLTGGATTTPTSSVVSIVTGDVSYCRFRLIHTGDTDVVKFFMKVSAAGVGDTDASFDGLFFFIQANGGFITRRISIVEAGQSTALVASTTGTAAYSLNDNIEVLCTYDGESVGISVNTESSTSVLSDTLTATQIATLAGQANRIGFQSRDLDRPGIYNLRCW